jgi:histidinol-phosphate aminotransferase
MQSFDVTKWVNPNILELAVYTSARDEYQGVPGVMLDANESPYENGVNRYPDPAACALKSRWAAFRNVSETQAILGNGSDEVLDMIFKCCQVKGGNIVVPAPSYGMYEVLAATYGMETRKVLLDEDFSLDAERLLAAVDEQTRLIILCSPNNPTGNVLASEAIDQVLRGFNGLVVVDEAYIDFAASPSWVSRLDNYPNLLVLQTCSKAWGMAGLRIGAAFSSPAVIDLLRKVKLPYNLNVCAQEKALSLWNPEEVAAFVTTNQTQREIMTEALVQLSFVQQVYPSDANFILVQCEDAKLLMTYLLEQQIVVRDRSSQSLCNNCLRITIGTPAENELLLKSLRAYEKSIVY